MMSLAAELRPKDESLLFELLWAPSCRANKAAISAPSASSAQGSMCEGLYRLFMAVVVVSKRPALKWYFPYKSPDLNGGSGSSSGIRASSG